MAPDQPLLIVFVLPPILILIFSFLIRVVHVVFSVVQFVNSSPSEIRNIKKNTKTEINKTHLISQKKKNKKHF